MNDSYGRSSLSTYEVARKLGISSQAVRELCKYGKIPGAYQTHKNGYWRIPVNSLDAINLNEVKNNLSWYDKVKYIIWVNKLRSLIILTAGILTFFFTAISAGADIGGAREQLIQWGIIRTFPKAVDDEILIVICRFNYSDNLVDTKIEEEIKRQIELTLANFNLDNFRIEIDQRRIGANEFNQAQELIFQHNATIVIWGEDTGIRVTVNMTSDKNPFEAKTIVDETNFAQIANPNQYQSFIISKLPAHISFISLFASGLVLERDKYYKPAIDIIEKAVSELKTETPVEGVTNAYFTLGLLYQQNQIDFESLELAVPHPYSNTPPDFSKNIGYNLDLNANNKAIEYYNLVVKLSPNGYTEFGSVYQNRGLARVVVGDYEGALNDFIDFYKTLRPDNSDVTPLAISYRGFARIGLIDDFYGGIEDISYSQELTNTEVTCTNATFLSFAYLGLEKKLLDSTQVPLSDPSIKYSVFDAKEAFYLYDSLIALNPSDCNKAGADILVENKTRAYFMRGYLNAQLGNHESALADFESLLRINPEYEDKETIVEIIESQKNAIESSK